jgi:hypothetical protein
VSFCHDVLRDARLFRLLPRIDAEFAAEARKARCRECGNRFHKATFPRKARGVPAELQPQYNRRHSFSCATRNCRKRLTPASVRYFGRRFYVAAAFVVLSAMQHGVTPKRIEELRELTGCKTISARTLYRWREWWREMFVATPFWKSARARFSPPVDAGALPASIIKRFRGDDRDRLVALLRFLSPLSTRTAMGA